MKKLVLLSTVVILCFTFTTQAAERKQINPEAKQFKFSTTIEKERPELDEETKRLIAAYRQNPTDTNYNALRKQAEINYDKVVERKKAKLEELKQTAKDASKVEEMQVIVDEMLKDRENRINQTMSRFTDKRLRPNARQTTDGFLPVLGAAQNVSIAYTPVTNKEYATFINETGHKAPKDWQNGTYPSDKENHPVVYVSYNDAVAYCDWLSNKDKTAKYRLPTEAEWELAAGHMPKDADMNCGENKGIMPVDTYKQTLSAAGSIDMWGNVWEWTSTTKDGGNAVKGGAWNTKRTNCRTENRSETRNASGKYDNVGFRMIREK